MPTRQPMGRPKPHADQKPPGEPRTSAFQGARLNLIRPAIRAKQGSGLTRRDARNLGYGNSRRPQRLSRVRMVWLGSSNWSPTPGCQAKL